MRCILILAAAALIAGCPVKPHPDGGSGGGSGGGGSGDSGEPPCPGNRPRNEMDQCEVLEDTPGFDCYHPIVVTPPDDAGVVTLSGTTDGFINLFDCQAAPHGPQASPNPDAVCYVDAGINAAVRVWVDPPAMLNTLPACMGPALPGTLCDLQLLELSGAAIEENPWRSDWPIFVDSSGPYTLHVVKNPTVCAETPAVIALDAAGTGFANGNARDLQFTACGQAGLFQFHTYPPLRRVSLSGDHLIFLGDSCSGGQCPVGGAAQLFPIVNGGDHLFADVLAPGEQSFAVTVNTGGPPLLCEQPTSLTLDGGVATFTGDLATAPDIGCEMVQLFQFTSAVPRNVTVNTTAGAIQWLGPTCTWANCTSPTPDAGPITALVAAGDSLFTVVNAKTSALPFTVTVTAPSSCDQPTELTFTAGSGMQIASASGDTSTALPDDPIGCVNGTQGPVQVFTFVTTATENLDALLSTTSSGVQPLLSLRGSCNGPDGACDQAVVPGAAAHVTGTSLPAGRYFLIVSSAGNGGPFTLDVTLTP
jgi:hypothetical protein